jgi:arginyl-tRNA synthetase
MKEKIITILSKQTGLKKEEIENHLEIPPSSELGDYAFPCFILAGKLKKNPAVIAKELAEKLSKEIKPGKEVEKIVSVNAYINFFVNKNILAENIINDILKKKDKYGKRSEGKRIMVEFASPNTNKPLHLGHLRNMAIGESVSRLLEFQGNKIIKTTLNNDRGIHICKSMLAYKLYGKNKTPEKEKIKSDHFVGDYYVLFAKKQEENPDLENKAQEMLRKWEAGDKEIRKLLEKMNKWALTGFKETYSLFGVKFDKEYYESKIYNKAKEIIQLGLEKDVFKKREDGAIIINLDKEKLGEKVILRADGTSIYVTQDLYLAKLKDEEYNLDGSIYVVANEQNYHFQVLFSILKKLKFKFTEKLYHLSYGMVNLPEGKMKSREGKVVDADDLIDEMKTLAKKELKARYKLNEKELNQRALTIALASIKYFLLKVDKVKDMIFNPNEAISFEGDTGPYLLYSYARASSILRKAKAKEINKVSFGELNEKEIELIKKINSFKEVIEQANKTLNPSLICNYSLELCQIFNDFYHSCQVIGKPEEKQRIALVQSFRIIISICLNLLNINKLEEM